jgi:hypothetical protein
MKSAWCAVFALAIAGTAWGRTPDGDEGSKEKKSLSVEESQRQVENLSLELEAQRAELRAQRELIESLKAQNQPLMTLNGLDPALQDKGKSTPSEDVKSKWAMNIYGFVEADYIVDSHQLAVGAVGNNQVALDAAGNPAWTPGRTYASEHGAVTFGARNSRIGLNVAAPEYAGIRASAKAEMDFLGTRGGTNDESNSTWTNPTFRIRHMYLTLDTDYITITFGQGWELFGWQPYFQPNTVDIQGVPGEVYSRSPKMQFSHKFKGPLDIELAAALSRPPQRSADSPDIQAGIKFTLPDWVGVHTVGATGTAVDAAGLGISGTTRAFQVAGGGGPDTSDRARGEAGALDLFLPLLHPEKESKANSISVTGEVAYGKGYVDTFSGFSGGIGGLAAPTGNNGPADGGNVDYIGVDLKPIQWRTNIVGVQYYLPPDGTWWISGNYGGGKSNDIQRFSNTPGGAVLNPATTFKTFRWINGNIFWDVTPAVRLGLSVDQYRDGFIEHQPTHWGQDTRVQFSAFFLF